MHPLHRWQECDDLKCRCNEWLAKQPEIPRDRLFSNHLGKRQRGERFLQNSTHGTPSSYVSGCRCERCREAVAQKMRVLRAKKKLLSS